MVSTCSPMSAPVSQGGYAVGTAIDGSLAGSNNGWAVAPQLGKPHVASFEVKDAQQHDGPILLTFVMKQEFSGNNWQLGKFRWSITNGPKPLKLNPGLPKNITDLLAKGPEHRRPNDIKVLRKFFNENDASTKALKTALANAKQPWPADPELKELQDAVTRASRPLPLDPRLIVLTRAVDLSTQQLADKRLYGAQDIAWALINNPAFLFNH